MTLPLTQDHINELYSNDTEKLRETWVDPPFSLFHPNVGFLSYKHVIKSIQDNSDSFFLSNINNNFLPESKTKEESFEFKRNAINRGIKTLNQLCETHMPEYAERFHIEEYSHPYNPLVVFTEARKKWEIIRNWKEIKEPPVNMPLARKKWIESGRKEKKPLDPRTMLEVYDSVRSWGLGHFVLIIDESPEIFNSLHYENLVENWLHKQLNFELDEPVNREGFSEDDYFFTTSAGIRVISEDQGYRHRAKVIGEDGKPNYSSLLMKMFSKKGFMDKIHDSYGVELVVETQDDVDRFLDYFKREIKGSSTLEKVDHVVKDDPLFECYKFILRAPVKVVTQDKEVEQRLQPPLTGILPLERVIRIPIEFQIRTHQPNYDHKSYKKNQFMKVFPLWFPREIYESLLSDSK